MSYKLYEEGMVRDSVTGRFFKADARSPDGEAYQKWLAKGNTPEPADPPIEPTIKEKCKAGYAIEAPDTEVMEALIETLDAAGLIIVGSKLGILKDKRQAIKSRIIKP